MQPQRYWPRRYSRYAGTPVSVGMAGVSHARAVPVDNKKPTRRPAFTCCQYDPFARQGTRIATVTAAVRAMIAVVAVTAATGVITNSRSNHGVMSAGA